jgi:hypothetical protein
VYQDLLNLMLDEDYGDITDVENGRDIRIVCEKQAGRQFATTSVTPRGSTTPLASDATQLTAWTSDLPDPQALYELKTYDALEKIVNDWLTGDDTSDTGTERGPSSTPSQKVATTTAAETTTTTHKTLDDAFADLEDI